MSTFEQEKQDPRVLKTKKSMAVAMFQLLEKSTFAKITVNDICSLALVSRTTFYQHFPDKYELVRYSVEQMAQELRAQADPDDFRATIENLLEAVMHRRQVFRNLFMDGANQELIRMLSDMSVQNLKIELEQRANLPGGAPAEVAAAFLSGGLSALLMRWIGSDFAMPKEELAGYLVAMAEARVARQGQQNLL